MRRSKRAPTGAMGVSMGSATILMVFAVVCLTLLSVLALMTANHEWKLAEKSAKAVTDYYAADAQAVRQYDAIRASGADYADFQVAIDENQQLQVQARRARDGWRILRWQVVSTRDWQPDQGLDVWLGPES